MLLQILAYCPKLKFHLYILNHSLRFRLVGEIHKKLLFSGNLITQQIIALYEHNS